MDGLNIIVLLGLALTLISVFSFLIERLYFPSILAFIAIGVGVVFFRTETKYSKLPVKSESSFYFSFSG